MRRHAGSVSRKRRAAQDVSSASPLRACRTTEGIPRFEEEIQVQCGSSVPSSPTTRSSAPCRGRGRFSRLGCWLFSGRSESASRMRERSSGTRVLRRCSSEAARRTGCTGAMLRPGSCARRSSSGRRRASRSRPGRRSSTVFIAQRGRPGTPRSGLLLQVDPRFVPLLGRQEALR